MRSEGEVIERLRRMNLAYEYSRGATEANNKFGPEAHKCHSELSGEIKDISGYFDCEDEHEGDYKKVFKILEWFLEGEPRYSVAELEKIAKNLIEGNTFIGETRNSYGDSPAHISVDGSSSVKEFVDFLKDKKKVEEILK